MTHASAPAAQQTVVNAQSAAADPIDVIVILDDSGSMATCWPWEAGTPPSTPPCQGYSSNAPSDPNELRYSAARLLVHLADSADRIAVLRFDSTAEGVGALSLLQQMGSPENRRRLAATLQAPEDYVERGYTRMDLGLREALQLLETHSDPNRSQYVLLLTDGEPTAPLHVPGQRPVIANLLAQIEDEGALLYPVILCNPDAGCAGDFIKSHSSLAREAKSSQDLLLIFSEIFAEMKSDRSVVTRRNTAGDLTISIRNGHGTGSIAFISPRAAITAVHRDGAPVETQSILDDGNIDLNVAVAPLPAGEWVAKTRDLSSFAVVQADSFPELLFPPPSVQGSPASTRYYPAGGSPLIVVAGAGPAADEPLLLNGTTPIAALGQDPISGRQVAALQLAGNPDELTLQLGEDRHPLQLRRTFRLQARDDLPKVQVLSPSAENAGIRDDGSLVLEVGFAAGVEAQNLHAAVYVYDVTGGGSQNVYRAKLSCHSPAAGRSPLCSDDGFTPQDGHDYEALFFVTAAVDMVNFGDFARTPLEVEPAIYVRGLPADIDLAKMPLEGWPLTVQASTVEEIGTLEASLILRRSDTSEIVRETSLNFSIEVPEQGSQAALLRIEGLELLRPGAYEGQLNLSAFNPAGLPMEVKVRPAPSLPVTLNIPRSEARIQVQEADFGELLFDTSPNFRLDEEILLPVAYNSDTPFRLTVELTESSCSDLTATAGDLLPAAPADGGSAASAGGSESWQQAIMTVWALPIRLQSQNPMSPGSCHGVLSLAGPGQDYDVLSDTLPFRLQIRDVEWSLAGALEFGNLGRAGERATETLLLRFDGKTPFLVQVVGVAASGETGSGVMTLDEQYLEAPPVEVNGLPDDEGFFEVPVTLVARKALPKDALRGSFYSGELVLSISGLVGETRSVDINFRSPTLYQRYVEWWLRPFYTFPLVLCSGPLMLLGLIIVVARARSRGYNVDDDEPITLPGQETPLTPQPDAAFVAPDFDGLQRQMGGSTPPMAGSPAGAAGVAPAFENFADAAGAGTHNAGWDSTWEQVSWDSDPSAREGSGDFDPPDNVWGNSPAGASAADPWA
ncbi:MAG: VWA domain-containing protein [Caldilineaceae bacterium]|nr:VWA domain-containing protein [Caldilineaceae bacterium]